MRKMNSMDDHLIVMLNETADMQIYICKCCGHYNLNYKNLFLCFTKKEFKDFVRLLKGLRPAHFNNIHPEGSKAVLSHKKYKGAFGFTQEEVENIISQIEQALIVEEAKKVLVN